MTDALPYQPKSQTEVMAFMLSLHIALNNRMEAEALLIELVSKAAMRGMDGCRSRGGA